jgi:hypothetical protein
MRLGHRPEPVEPLLRLRRRPIRPPRQRLARPTHPVDQVRVRLALTRDDLVRRPVRALCGQQALRLVERVALRQRAHPARLGAQRVPLDEELAAQQRMQGLPQPLQLRA